jgi:hypothetical protein
MSRLMEQFEVETSNGSLPSRNALDEPLGAERTGP